MKKNLILAVLIFSLSLNLAVVLMVGYHWRHRRSARFPGGPFPLENLTEKLTPGQLDEIRRLREQSFAEAESLRKDLWQRRELLTEELLKPEPNREEVDEILRDIARMQFELEKKVVEDLLRIGELLPPAQRKRVFNALRERLKETGRWKHGRGPFVPRRIEGR